MCAPLLFVSPVLAAQALSEEFINELSWLSDEGADSLSFLLLDEAEPNLNEDPEVWTEWHKTKINILRQRGRWEDIIREYETLPVNVPDHYITWMFVEVVKAYLTMGGGEQARDLLLSLIWDSGKVETDLALWRRLVVQSYLVDGRYDDAHTAVLRYEQDYPDAEQDPDWLGLKARLLIANDLANEAAVLTVASDKPAARSAYVLARLKGLMPLDADLLNEALHWLEEPQLDLALKLSLFDALFEKARQIKDWPQRITALERLLVVDHIEMVQATAVVDALWYSLTEYGQLLANQHQLLVGNFSPWFELAEELSQSEPDKAEALYAWLAVHAQGADINARAHELLVKSLDQQGRTKLLRALYLSSSQFTDVNVLPLALMYRLIDLALAEGNLALASKLMSQLDAPEGVDVIEWQLRRARVQILAGVPEYGAQLLQEIVAADSLTNEQIGNLMLGVQDLKNKGSYEAAYTILAQLLHKAPESSWQCELLFWMGEIRMAQKDYNNAARLYLHAAKLASDDQRKEWMQAAHQRGALALERAGLPMDAINVYQALLSTSDTVARSIYQNKIRQLMSVSK